MERGVLGHSSLLTWRIQITAGLAEGAGTPTTESGTSAVLRSVPRTSRTRAAATTTTLTKPQNSPNAVKKTSPGRASRTLRAVCSRPSRTDVLGGVASKVRAAACNKVVGAGVLVGSIA